MTLTGVVSLPPPPFSVSGCGHCKKLAPALEAAATKIKDVDDKLVFAKVNPPRPPLLRFLVPVCVIPNIRQMVIQMINTRYLFNLHLK